MLTEMRYTPGGSSTPYGVYLHTKNGWILLKNFADESLALALAKQKSKEPDLPYRVRFEHGEIINNNGSIQENLPSIPVFPHK